MNGAESLVRTLLASGVDTCFANPGTSEMHFVAALDRISGMRCVLCLQENVVTGAADGYYRITGKPAATLLHCGGTPPMWNCSCLHRLTPSIAVTRSSMQRGRSMARNSLSLFSQ